MTVRLRPSRHTWPPSCRHTRYPELMYSPCTPKRPQRGMFSSVSMGLSAFALHTTEPVAHVARHREQQALGGEAKLRPRHEVMTKRTAATPLLMGNSHSTCQWHEDARAPMGTSQLSSPREVPEGYKSNRSSFKWSKKGHMMGRSLSAVSAWGAEDPMPRCFAG